MEELKNQLRDLGANFVVTEEDLKNPEMKEIVKVCFSVVGIGS